MNTEMNTDLSLDRPKPHDEEAERYFISWLITNKTNKKDNGTWTIIMRMSEKYFYHPLFAKIFAGWKITVETNNIVNADNISINSGVSIEKIKELGRFYKETRKKDPIDTMLLRSFDRVIETYRLREIISICTEAIQRCYAYDGDSSAIETSTSKQLTNIYK